MLQPAISATFRVPNLAALPNVSYALRMSFNPKRCVTSVPGCSLPASAIAALNAHCKRQDEFRRQFGPDYHADLDLIFANPDGAPLKPDSISAAVSLLFRRLKLPKGASLHSLRHTHTSHLLASGVPLPAISARLGHASIRTTQEIYAHMIHGQDDEAARKWEEFQNQPTVGEPQQKQVQ